MLILLVSSKAIAWETDQYTLSAQPIAETGEEISQFIYQHLLTSTQLAKQHRLLYAQAIKKLTLQLNQKKQLRKKRHQISRTKLSYQIKQLQQRLDNYQADHYQTPLNMARLVQKSIGRAVSQVEKEDAFLGNVTHLTPYISGKKAQQQIAFSPDIFDSIYAYAGFHRFLHASYFIFLQRSNFMMLN